MTKFIKINRAFKFFKYKEKGKIHGDWVWETKEISEMYLNADYIASFQQTHLNAKHIESFKQTFGENSEPELFKSIIYLSTQYTPMEDGSGSSLLVKESVEEILSQLKK